MGLRTLALEVELWGKGEGCVVQAQWIRPMFRVSRVRKAKLRLQRRVGLGDWQRLKGGAAGGCDGVDGRLGEGGFAGMVQQVSFLQ